MELFDAGAVTLWGTRLAGYLFWRVLQTGKVSAVRRHRCAVMASSYLLIKRSMLAEISVCAQDSRLSQFFPKDDKEPLLVGQSQ